ncbi:MAG: radical SAM protein [Eubacteriales bacterium]|nr:radical SAM protein [Bacillota bacterium]MBV1727050.1 radical SAM protein [Desulforudis sp.]MDP3050750.1 radical SAM protein [Eubacteriales bacterium]MDQ7789166.1 radical SAM protein [Clostridia bacterium]MBU4533104.1 radical SAM protein [Bacillota bacterium]
MLSISKIISGQNETGDHLRYRRREGPVRPVVVWNSTRACNLRCKHCYASARLKPGEGELSTTEAKQLIDDLAAYRVPVILFSGGEPLMRPDFFELANLAREKGIRPTVSTNGTLITREVAWRLKETGVGYAGISIDGMRDTNDRMRGYDGAFDAAIEGVRHCVAVGQRVGLRFTITRDNYREVDQIFDLVESESIDRVCFYHLVYSGRGSQLIEQDLNSVEKRAVVDRIYERTADLCRRGLNKEILTVDNHADVVYSFLKLKDSAPVKAEEVWQWLQNAGGNRSGIAIGCVDWHGDVHPDQFTMNHTLGNVRERKFGDIWEDDSHPIMAGLKERKPLLHGRCAACRWLSICNGNFRPRAEAVSGDFWAPDPACYLTDEEIGI